MEGVEKELNNLDLDSNTINSIKEFITIDGSNEEILERLEGLGIDNEIFEEGLNDLKTVVKYIGLFGVPENNYKIDLTIARG